MSEVIKSKLKKLFKKAKKGKEKSNNVVSLKRDLRVVSNTSNPVNFEEIEKDKINQYGRSLAKEIEEYSKQFRMSPGFFYYHLLFHIKQAAAFSCHYAEYKHVNNYSTEEIARNQGEMLAESCQELGLEKRKESDTVQ